MITFTEFLNERYKEPTGFTKNSYGWNVPNRTIVDDVFDHIVQIICDENYISEKNFKGVDNTIEYVRGYFDNNQDILQDIDEFKGKRAKFCAEYLYDKHFNNKNKITEQYENSNLIRKRVEDWYGYETYEYFYNNEKIGYIHVIFSKTPFSNGVTGSEFYLDYIEVKEDFRNKGYGKMILSDVIEMAKQKKADNLTLKVDNGIGFGGRYPGNKLVKLYSLFGFKYQWSEDELKKSDERNPGAMILKLN